MLIFSLIFLEVLIFAGLIFILRNIMSKNVLTATKHLEGMGQEYAKKEKEIEKLLDEARQKAQEIVAKSEADTSSQKAAVLKAAEEEKVKFLNAAQAKVDEMIQQADRASKALLAEMNRKVEESARSQAVRLLKSALPEELRKEIHQRWVADLIAGNLKQLEHLRLDEGIKEASVAVAFSLSHQEKDALVAKINEKLGRSLDLKEELDTELISGIVIKIGSLVFDGSLKSRIQQASYNQ